MSRVLPILFNTDMVRAILNGRKTVTRRMIKYKYSNTEMKMHTDKYGTRLIEIQKDVEGETFGKNPDGSTWHKLRGYIEPQAPYKPGDILYVREAWRIHSPGFPKVYIYRADYSDEYHSKIGFKPSIHMPKEAARIWLKVTDVRVERLLDMPHDAALKEGVHFYKCPDGFTWKPKTDMSNCYTTPMGAMRALWNSTIKKADLDCYGWDVDPWVWVIEFERCEKPELQ